jgi:hypothetical protein
MHLRFRQRDTSLASMQDLLKPHLAPDRIVMDP